MNIRVQVCDLTLATLLPVILLLAASVADAGRLPVPQHVMARARQESDAIGIPLGTFRGFRAYPRLAVRGGYDDNVRAQESRVRDDLRATLAPSILVESQWSRHSVAIASFLESRLHGSEGREDSLEWGVGVTGQLEVKRSTNLNGSINYQSLTEDRSGIEVVTANPDPSKYGELDLSVGVDHRFNRLRLSVGGEFADLRYDTREQEFRDREIFRGAGQMDYFFSPGYSAFVRVAGIHRAYGRRSTVTQGMPKQDSTGYQAVGGISSELTNLISGEVYVGYLDQDYDSTRFTDVNGVSFGASMSWIRTSFTTLRIRVSRDAVDSTTGGAGGLLQTTAGVSVDHELNRDLRLHGDFDYYLGDYEGISRKDNGFRVSASIEYRLTRWVHVDLRYRFDSRRSNVSGQAFDRNRVDFGVKFQI